MICACITAEFKDSLGKLKVSSLSNPRQTIDVDMNFESETTDRSMNSKDIARKRKTQLGALEKVITLLAEHYIWKTKVKTELVKQFTCMQVERYLANLKV